MALDPALARSLAIGRDRARLASWALALAVAVALAVTVGGMLVAQVFARALDGHFATHAYANALDETNRWLRAAEILANLVAAVFFLRWLHRAVAVAAQLAPDPPLAVTPGAACASFFIPFANLVQPMVVVSKLDAAADPDPLPLPVERVAEPLAGYRSPAWSERVVPWQRVRSPVAAWWLLYIGPLVLVSFLPDGTAGSLADHEASAWRMVVFTASRVVAGLLAVAVVRGIDARLAERARRLAALPEA